MVAGVVCRLLNLQLPLTSSSYESILSRYWRLLCVSPLRAPPSMFSSASFFPQSIFAPAGEASSTTIDLDEAVVMLRYVNALVFFPLSAYVYWCLLRHLHFGRQSVSGSNFSASKHSWLLLRTVCIATMPTHFFFFFLYYTDGLSTLLVLAGYYFMTTAVVVVSEVHGSTWRRSMLLSGLCGALSIMVRQTNVVWTCATAGLALWRLDPSPDFRFIPRLLYSVLPFDILRTPWLSPSISSRTGAAKKTASPSKNPSTVLLGRNRYGLLWVGLQVVWPHALCVCVFAVWVVFLNGGHVVLGHKEYHTAVVHWAQVVYLAAFLLLAAWPSTWSAFCNVWLPKGRDARRRRAAAGYAVVCCAGSFLCMYSSRNIVHPFLLADNRHYMFYIWKRLLRHQIARLLVVPLGTGFFLGTVIAHYALPSKAAAAAVPWWRSLSSVWETSQHGGGRELASNSNNFVGAVDHASFPTGTIAKHVDCPDDVDRGTGLIHAAALAVGSLLCVVPAELLEVRYWTMPALLLLLHLPPRQPRVNSDNGHPEDLWITLRTEWLCLVTHMCVNVVVFYVFLYCPFATEEGSELSRFMY
eukprot:GHVS01076161.1.p1 GENE.GHVS01076161.1~~GHVS01076161.1.p1  ORF type:complete len:582 (+),score=47.50 GHVS01076161.1:520-2265(+)